MFCVSQDVSVKSHSEENLSKNLKIYLDLIMWDSCDFNELSLNSNLQLFIAWNTRRTMDNFWYKVFFLYFQTVLIFQIRCRRWEKTNMSQCSSESWSLLCYNGDNSVHTQRKWKCLHRLACDIWRFVENYWLLYKINNSNISWCKKDLRNVWQIKILLLKHRVSLEASHVNLIWYRSTLRQQRRACLIKGLTLCLVRSKQSTVFQITHAWLPFESILLFICN